MTYRPQDDFDKALVEAAARAANRELVRQVRGENIELVADDGIDLERHLARAVLAAVGPMIAARALREAARGLSEQGTEPWNRNDVAIRTLNFRADAIEAGGHDGE